MEGGEPGPDVGRDAHRIGDAQCPVGAQTTGQRAARDKPRCQVARAVRLPRVEHRDEVRVPQLPRDPHLVLEAPEEDLARRELRPQDLQRDGYSIGIPLCLHDDPDGSLAETLPEPIRAHSRPRLQIGQHGS